MDNPTSPISGELRKCRQNRDAFAVMYDSELKRMPAAKKLIYLNFDQTIRRNECNDDYLAAKRF